MRRALLGTLLIAGLVTATVALAQQRGEVFAQRPTQAVPTLAAATGSELIVVPTSLGEKAQILTVVDPRQRVMCVYHIDLATGKIALKSARNIQWDLQIANFNNEKPLPEEIHSSLEQK